LVSILNIEGFIMTQVRFYDKNSEFSGVTRREVSCEEVRCSACRHAVRFRAYPEIIDCTQFNRMENANSLRQCAAFEASK